AGRWPPSGRRPAPSRGGGPSARCAPPTAGTGRARSGSRTSAPLRPVRAARGLLQLEPQRRRSQLDLVASGQAHGAPRRPTVDDHAVGGPEVGAGRRAPRSEEHTSELQSRRDLVCRLLLEKKKKTTRQQP